MNKNIKFIVVIGVIIAIFAIFLIAKQSSQKPASVTSAMKEYQIQPSNQSISSLPEVQDSKIVELKNGDTYNLTASIVD
jgi:hypothetical protein